MDYRYLVLAMLLVNREKVVSTDRLIDAVWGDIPPENGRKIVQRRRQRRIRMIRLSGR